MELCQTLQQRYLLADGEINPTASDNDFQASCPKGTCMLAFLTSWGTSGDSRRQRHQLRVTFENKTTVTCKREQSLVVHWWYSPWLNQCFCIMHDLQWIVDVERNAAHLLKTRPQWKYFISNIHLTPHVSLYEKIPRQISAYINIITISSIPCLLYPPFVLAVQTHLEDQTLPVHTVYISGIKRFLIIKERMWLLLLDLSSTHCDVTLKDLTFMIYEFWLFILCKPLVWFGLLLVECKWVHLLTFWT